MGPPTVFTISVAGQGEKFGALIQLKIYRFFFLLLNIGRQKIHQNGDRIGMVLLIFIWGSLSETRYIGDWGAPDYEELPNVVLPTWFPNLAPATTINKWVVPLLCAPVGIKNKLHSLLDNAPNYQVGCVIQKGWWNRFYLGGPEWLEVSSWKNNWKEKYHFSYHSGPV